jgi:hypothetical protein
MLPWLQPSVALARMKPYTVALCVLRSRRGYGLASSDPYQSAATPLATLPELDTPMDIRSMLDGISVGLLVICSFSHQLLSERQSIAESILQNGAFKSEGLCLTSWECSLTQEDILHHCATNDLWENISVDLESEAVPPSPDQSMPMPLRPHQEAAIALQHLLDEEIGGWANTFG